MTIVARATVKGRSLRSSITIPSKGLDCLKVLNIAASPLEPPHSLAMAVHHIKSSKHDRRRFAVTYVTQRTGREAARVKPHAAFPLGRAFGKPLESLALALVASGVGPTDIVMAGLVPAIHAAALRR
ncbi:MAG: hypothetical protein JO223_08515 [Hyphomicrobiales bacterium]|nr:hypothetical protein [Hyphomicrobiales bacterium]